MMDIEGWQNESEIIQPINENNIINGLDDFAVFTIENWRPWSELHFHIYLWGTKNKNCFWKCKDVL